MDYKVFLEWSALNNAVKYNGKANTKALIGSILGAFPEKKTDMKQLMQDLDSIVRKINAIPLAKQRTRLESLGGAKKSEKRIGLKPLKDVKEGELVMRFAPSPSGALHIGHAYTLLLSAIYCKTYKGKLIVRIEDTNPDNIYDAAYELIKEDATWITKNGVDTFAIQSERMELYYAYAEQILKKDFAYICTCDPEKFRSFSLKKKACPCRDLPRTEQLSRWESMLSEWDMGAAIMRIKTDIEHKNPALRDFPAFRINTHTHPRQGIKYRVWPLMNFSVFVDDVEMGMTHILRAKDHADNAKKQAYLYTYFNKPLPHNLFVGKINFEGLPLSSSKTKEKILTGEYLGWDDCRLPFLPALRKRGYQPEAFWRYATEVGVSSNDKTVPGKEFFKSLNAFNKAQVDVQAFRFFIVRDPIEIFIEHAPTKKIEMDLHPDNKKGGRVLNCSPKLFIEREDYALLKEGALYRLKDAFNFTKKGTELVFTSEDLEEYKQKGKYILHFLSCDDDLVDIKISLPNGSIILGKGESSLINIDVGTLIQAERVGFLRLDAIEDKTLHFYFAHK